MVFLSEIIVTTGCASGGLSDKYEATLDCRSPPASAGESCSALRSCPELGAEALERYASLLEASSDYRVLRRLRPARAMRLVEGTAKRRGIYVDVETTGLDPTVDGIVELAMLA